MSQVLRPPLRLRSLLPIGGLEQGKAIDKAARFFSACWIAQLAAVRLMAACITHFRRDGSMSFLSNCVFDPT